MADPHITLVFLREHLNTPDTEPMIIRILLARHKLSVLEIKFPVKIVLDHHAVHPADLGYMDRYDPFFHFLIFFHTFYGIIKRIGEHRIQVDHRNMTEIAAFHTADISAYSLPA